MMSRFLTWCRSLFTPRHKRIAQQAIDSLNEAIRLADQAIASLNRVRADLERTSDELLAYQYGAMEPDVQSEEIARLNRLPDLREEA